MKKLNILFILLLATNLIWFSSCEERIETDYTPYKPSEDISITYEDVSLYPMLTTLASDTPNIQVEAVYTLIIDSVKTANGAYNFSNFKIDQNSGVITYDNSDGSINPGEYLVTVIIATPNAYNKEEDVLKLTIKDVPVSLTATPAQYTAGALEQGDIATVSYTDESPDQSISEVTYALSPEVTGYSIDETSGVISKTTEAIADTTIALNIKTTTNLGVKTIDSVILVTVSPPPTIEMKQSNSTEKLNSVTISPWTAYSTGTPDLQGMNADEGWEVLVADTNNLGATINPAWFTIDAQGVISIAADQNLPVGDIVLGVRPTNSSGISYDFDSLFTIHVEKRWEDTNIIDGDFQDGSGNPELGTSFTGYVVNNAEQNVTFVAVNYTRDDPHRDLRTARLLTGKNVSGYDAVLVMDIDLTANPDARDFRLSFEQLVGYGALALDNFQRTLAYSYDNEPANSGTYTPDEWTEIMASNDADWLDASYWGSSSEFDDYDSGDGYGVVPLPATPYRELGITYDANQTNVYVAWRYLSIINPTTAGTQWLIDNVMVDIAKAFPAEEQ